MTAGARGFLVGAIAVGALVPLVPAAVIAAACVPLSFQLSFDATAVPFAHAYGFPDGTQAADIICLSCHDKNQGFGTWSFSAHARPDVATVYAPPTDDLEGQVAAIWERVLALLASRQLDVRPIIGGVWRLEEK